MPQDDYTTVRMRTEDAERLRTLCDVLDMTYAELVDFLLSGIDEASIEAARKEMENAKSRAARILRGETTEED